MKTTNIGLAAVAAIGVALGASEGLMAQDAPNSATEVVNVQTEQAVTSTDEALLVSLEKNLKSEPTMALRHREPVL